MINNIMTKDKAIKDLVDSVYEVLQIKKAELKEIATEIVNEMFGDKEKLTAQEYVNARCQLQREAEKENTTSKKNIVKLFYAGLIPELDSDVNPLSLDF